MVKNLDRWFICALLVIGSLTHFVGLTQPNQVIFDEVHFGKFVTAYCCTGERFFDIHPPHAKLLIAAVARLGGYDGGFDFDHIGEPYDSLPIFWLRLLPALSGIILPLIVYVLLRQLGGRWPIALFGAVALLLDNALLVQTRIIALDGVLLVSTFGSLSAFLVAERKKGIDKWIFLVISGALAGLAVGTKFTGLAVVALIGLIILVRMWQQRARNEWRQWLIVSSTLLVSAVIVYLAGWVGHYTLLTKPGFGDAFHQVNLSGAPLPIAWLRDVWELHQVMFSANYNLTAQHPYESAWWSWPLMLRPVFYWQGTNADIYFIGNPVVWWGAFVLFVTAISALIIRFGWRKKYSAVELNNIEIWIPIAGFIIAMAPLARVPRALFLYHYLTPLIFSMIVGLLWLELEGFFTSNLRGWRLYTFIGVIVLMLGVFLMFSPLTYGYQMIPGYRDALLWSKSWL